MPVGKVINAPVEMLSIYPTLLDLCGLPKYDRNEGKSLVPMMLDSKKEEGAYAISTFGMNNHTVKVNGYRYIQYEDGKEEFYDHSTDLNEWDNQASNPKYKDEIEKMKTYLPKTNSKWDAKSSYTFQPYFIEQKARTSEKKVEQVEIIGADE